jgi:ATP-dependent DNA ligase
MRTNTEFLGWFPMLPISKKTEPMEAKSVDELPVGPGWQYEPKWDGFRCLVFRDGGRVAMQSRKQKPLNRYFPELVAGFEGLSSRRFVIDGEIILMRNGQPSFEALQLRLHPAASRIRRLAEETPATFMAFDMLLNPIGKDLRKRPLTVRRAALQKLFRCRRKGTLRTHDVHWLQISPATNDLAAARQWLKLIGKGIDGIVAKRSDDGYHAGERTMQKFKIWKTIDCVIGGLYLDARKAIEYLLLGLYDEGGFLNYVGRVRPPEDRVTTERRFRRLRGGEGFTGRSPGGKSRWSGKERVPLMLTPKIVVEVSADHITGEHMRHGSRFLRWRPDKKPKACTMEQIRRPK